LSETVAIRCLSNFSIPKLREMALSKRAIQSHLEEIRHNREEFSQVARQNNQLLKQFKKAFSREIVDQAVSRLNTTKQEQIEQGIIALADHMGSFRAMCETI